LVIDPRINLADILAVAQHPPPVESIGDIHHGQSCVPPHNAHQVAAAAEDCIGNFVLVPSPQPTTSLPAGNGGLARSAYRRRFCNADVPLHRRVKDIVQGVEDRLILTGGGIDDHVNFWVRYCHRHNFSLFG
jgi:hypothetical protein